MSMQAHWCCLPLLLLGACGPDPEPTNSRFWLAAGGFESEVSEMFRRGDQIELHSKAKRSLGTLTPVGLQAWDDAIASVDPDAIGDPYTCADVDGVDVCVELESATGDPLDFCYCVSPLAPEFAVFDAYFSGLAFALSLCESTEHITVDSCG